MSKITQIIISLLTKAYKFYLDRGIDIFHEHRNQHIGNVLVSDLFGKRQLSVVWNKSAKDLSMGTKLYANVIITEEVGTIAVNRTLDPGYSIIQIDMSEDNFERIKSGTHRLFMQPSSLEQGITCPQIEK